MPLKVIKGEYMDRHLVKSGGGENWKNILHTCPVCGEELKAGLSRAAHLSKHKPDEFGLSPMMDA